MRPGRERQCCCSACSAVLVEYAYGLLARVLGRYVGGLGGIASGFNRF
jgi:hypothetical protein